MKNDFSREDLILQLLNAPDIHGIPLEMALNRELQAWQQTAPETSSMISSGENRDTSNGLAVENW